MLNITISWVAALILISPFLLGVLFWIVKETKRIRNRWIRDAQEINRLEWLVCEARDALVGAEIALETPETKELAKAVEAYKEESGNSPKRPEDLDIPCTPNELFRAEQLLEAREVRGKLEPIWDQKCYYAD